MLSCDLNVIVIHEKHKLGLLYYYIWDLKICVNKWLSIRNEAVKNYTYIQYIPISTALMMHFSLQHKHEHTLCLCVE